MRRITFFDAKEDSGLLPSEPRGDLAKERSRRPSARSGCHRMSHPCCRAKSAVSGASMRGSPPGWRTGRWTRSRTPRNPAVRVASRRWPRSARRAVSGQLQDRAPIRSSGWLRATGGRRPVAFAFVPWGLCAERPDWVGNGGAAGRSLGRVGVVRGRSHRLGLGAWLVVAPDRRRARAARSVPVRSLRSSAGPPRWSGDPV